MFQAPDLFAAKTVLDDLKGIVQEIGAEVSSHLADAQVLLSKGSSTEWGLEFRVAIQVGAASHILARLYVQIEGYATGVKIDHYGPEVAEVKSSSELSAVIFESYQRRSTQQYIRGLYLQANLNI